MPPGISTTLPTPTLPIVFKGLRETLAAFPPPWSLGPKARSLTGVCRRLRGPPPPSRPSAGREPACLSRPIYHRHTNNTRESAETLPRSPCPHGSRRTEPWSVTAPAGSGWEPTGSGCPERTAGPPRSRPPALPPARLPGHSHSSARWAVLFLSCLIPNWAGSTGVVLREQEIGEGGGEEQPGSDASGSELKTQSRRPRAGRKSGLRGPRGAARNAPPGEVTLASRSPLAARPSPLPSGALRSPGRGSPACVGGRGPAGPAKGWRESLMSCAAH